MNENKSVHKYSQIIDHKGNITLHPIFLRDTPDSEIERMNEYFDEWKTTVQIEYDKDGNRLVTK
jgi:hypothetical protein